MRGALMVLVMLATCVTAAAAGRGAASNAALRAPPPAHAALRRALQGRVAGVPARASAGLRPIVQAVPAGGGRRQVAYHARPGHGVLGGPAPRPAVMGLSGVRRRP